MSKTTKKNINASEFYATPEWIIEEFFRNFDKADKDWWMFAKVLDPSAGGGSPYHFGMPYPDVIQRMYNITTDTIDIRPGSLAATIGDFLEMPIATKYKMIVTNPPFSLADKFVTKALEHIEDQGYVVVLQRLGWMGSKGRFQFWNDSPLHSVYVHHKRPKFHGATGTDSIEYAHFVFKKNFTGTPKIYIV